MLSHDSVFFLIDIPADVIEAAFGGDGDETDAVTDPPPGVRDVTADFQPSGVNTQTASAGLTSSVKFGSSVTNELPLLESWEKNPATDSSPRALASGYHSNGAFDDDDDDAYYDDNFHETQQHQTGSGPAQIRPIYQAAYTEISDVALSAHTRMPHVKSAARSPSAMRRNVDAQAHSSGQTKPVGARMAPDGGVRWVKVEPRDDGEGVSIGMTATESSVTLPVMQPKLHRKSKGAVTFLFFF